MAFCKQYRNFLTEARAVAWRAACLYDLTENIRVIAVAKQELERLANFHLRRLPSVHCANGRCVLTEWKRLVKELDDLVGQRPQHVSERYQELVAQAEERRRRIGSSSYRSLPSARNRRRRTPVSRLHYTACDRSS